MKVKQLLYGMMYGLLIFFTASCSEENSENLPDNVAIYQSYLVAFSDSQPTLTYARFSPEKKDVPLKEIKLTGGASIMANGKEMEYHYFDGNTIFGYSYSLSLGKDEQVSFVFQRKRQQETRMLTNYAYKEWINEIHIPSELTTIANQEVIGWKGEKIVSNEELEATLDNPSHLEEYTAYYGTLNESRDGVSFKNVPKGKYMLTLKRILKLETKDNDAPAKGEIRLVFYDKKEVTVK